jgi:hypothetical protein
MVNQIRTGNVSCHMLSDVLKRGLEYYECVGVRMIIFLRITIKNIDNTSVVNIDNTELLPIKDLV